jgi:hypothetical protein
LPYSPVMRAAPPRLRAVALVAAGALVLHELRYLVGFGHEADTALAHQGHGYLSLAGVGVGLLVATAAAQLLALLGRARRGDAEGGKPRPFRVTWLAVAVALAAVYTSQELAEGLFATGHPAGLAGVFGHGGWVAYPLALAVGAVVALGLRGAAAAVRAVAALRRPPRIRLRARAWRSPPAVDAPRLPVLALCAAGRAPPRA